MPVLCRHLQTKCQHIGITIFLACTIKERPTALDMTCRSTSVGETTKSVFLLQVVSRVDKHSACGGWVCWRWPWARRRIWRQPAYLSPAHQHTLAHAGLLLELVHVVLHQRALPPHVKGAPLKLQLGPATLDHTHMQASTGHTG